MSETKTSFSWCRLILYIVSALIAYFIANRFAPIQQGLMDVLIALLLFLVCLFLLMWVSRFICGMLGGKSSDDEHGLSGRTAAGAGVAAAGVAGAATASRAADDYDEDHAAQLKARDAEAQARAEAEAAEERARIESERAKADAERAKREAAKEAEADKARKAAEAAEAKAKKDADAAKAKADKEKAAADKAKKDAEAAKAKAEADKKAKAEAEAKAKSAKSADATATAVSVGTKPKNAMSGARGGKADNLKEIKGIGPKLEKLCHSLGIYHFDQIADWDKDEIAWMDGNLEGFHGRVTRDNWVGQAKILASGGETEFSKRVEDGDVY